MIKYIAKVNFDLKNVIFKADRVSSVWNRDSVSTFRHATYGRNKFNLRQTFVCVHKCRKSLRKNDKLKNFCRIFFQQEKAESISTILNLPFIMVGDRI